MTGNHCNYCLSCVLLMAEIDKRGGERMGKYTDDEIRTIPTVTIKAAADYDCEALL